MAETVARRAWGWLVLFAIVIGLSLLLGGRYWLGLQPFGERGELVRGLARRGGVAVVSGGPWSLHADGTSLQAVAPGTPLARALSAGGRAKVAGPLRAAGFDALLVDPQNLPVWAEEGSVVQRLARYETVAGMVGRYLAREVALYAPDPIADIPTRQREALALVARRILAGERPPRVQSFPEGLRSVEHVEVMVLLRSGPRPRLWRSARGSSIARAFLTAVRVAKTRWHERETAMGGALSEMLPRMHVEVSLLQDDGELGTRSADFVDRVVTADHGVAYDHKGAWRYLLPGATREQGGGRATRAFGQLLLDHGLPADLGRPDIRPYRLRVRQLSVSPPTRSTPDPLAPPDHPDEVLGRRLP